MEWLQVPSYWWSLIGTIANISLIAVVTATLIYLWFGKNTHAWGATLTFMVYLVLFWLEPPAAVKAFQSEEVFQPQAALRTVFFALSLALLLIKALRVRPH